MVAPEVVRNQLNVEVYHKHVAFFVDVLYKKVEGVRTAAKGDYRRMLLLDLRRSETLAAN